MTRRFSRRRIRKWAGGQFSRRTRKYNGAKRRVWRKVHIGIDEQTLEVRAVEVTSRDAGDAAMLPELLSQIPPDQKIASVTAAVACDTRKCHDAIAERGPAPSFRRAGMRNPERPPPQAPPPSPATRPCARQNTSARSGDDGAVTTAKAASGYEPGQKMIRGIVFPANGCTA